MTNQGTPVTPAGWYPDPAGGGRSRWWDGAQWTEHYHDPYSATAVDLKAPDGIPVYTPWIWLLIVIPFLPLLGLLAIDWGGLLRFDANDPSSIYRNELAVFTSPGYLLTVLGGWVVYALSALFAYFDWRELKKREVPRPFHFAWVFLSSIVYVIGRSVVVRRRTGRGIAPMWWAIASIAFSLVISIVITVEMVSSIVTQLPSYTH